MSARLALEALAQRIRESGVLPEPSPASPMLERKRQRATRHRAPTPLARLLAELGNPEACGVCGTVFIDEPDRPDPRCIDHRHDTDAIRGVVCVRCNLALGTMDLRFSDPDRWRALVAWSSRGAPAVPTGRKRSTVRRIPARDPELFGDEPSE